MPGVKPPTLSTNSTKVQISNKTQWNADRDHQTPDFFTVGYSGRSSDEFVGTLVESGVAFLVDIRNTPVSMHRPEFSKGNLSAALGRAGIDYVHLPHLGVPKDVRNAAADSGTRSSIWEWYDSNVLPKATRNLHWLFDSVEHPAAFMCVERDPTECHRHRLALALERKGFASADL